LFVAATFGVLAALVVLFGRAPALFSNRAGYTVTFPEAPGVAVGTPVRKSGVRIGEVVGIDLDETANRVRIRVQLERKYPPRTSDEVTISRGILSGDTALDVVPMVDPKTNEARPLGDPYPPDSVIAGVPPVNARTLLGQASAVLPNANESLARIVGTSDRLQQAIPRLEKAADEIAALAKSAREFVPELRRTNAQVQELLGVPLPGEQPGQPAPRRNQVSVEGQPPDPTTPTLRNALAEIIELLKTLRPAAEDIRTLVRQNSPELTRALQAVRQTADSATDLLNPENRKAVAATVKNLQTASEDLTRTIRLVGILADQAEKTLKEVQTRFAQAGRAVENIERATQPIADNAGPIIQNLASAAEQLTRTLAEVQQLVKQANRPDGTLGRVLADPALFNNLNESAAAAARVLARVEKIARDLEVFADKVARRPEVIGIGGAVRPSTGLKESPTAPLPVTPPGPLPPAGGLAPIPPVGSGQ
jgi:phospholipid/cholesterol/gamma-HCH transport system substrate-binding protein